MWSRRLTAISDGDVMTSDDRAFQTRAAETAKARSPTVMRRWNVQLARRSGTESTTTVHVCHMFVCKVAALYGVLQQVTG